MTPTLQQHPDTRDWLSKAEVAVLLSVSTKSVERYANEGMLTRGHRAQHGSPALVVYNPADVELLRVKLWKPPVVLPPSAEVERTTERIAASPRHDVELTDRLQPVWLCGSELRDIATAIATASEHLRHVAHPALMTELRHIAEVRRPLPAYVALPTAVKLSGLSRNTIKMLARSEQTVIKTMRYGRGVRYRRADLESL